MRSIGLHKCFGYVIAFEKGGVTDVTRRYSRLPKRAGERKICSEGVLLYVMQKLAQDLRRDLSDEEKQQLKDENEREQAELESYIAHAMADDPPSIDVEPATSHHRLVDHVKARAVSLWDGVTKKSKE